MQQNIISQLIQQQHHTTVLINAVHGSSNVEGSGIIELNLAFPNATSIKSGDEFRVCSMVLKDLRMIYLVLPNS